MFNRIKGASVNDREGDMGAYLTVELIVDAVIDIAGFVDKVRALAAETAVCVQCSAENDDVKVTVVAEPDFPATDLVTFAFNEFSGSIL